MTVYSGERMPQVWPLATAEITWRSDWSDAITEMEKTLVYYQAKRSSVTHRPDIDGEPWNYLDAWVELEESLVVPVVSVWTRVLDDLRVGEDSIVWRCWHALCRALGARASYEDIKERGEPSDAALAEAAEAACQHYAEQLLVCLSEFIALARSVEATDERWDDEERTIIPDFRSPPGSDEYRKWEEERDKHRERATPTATGS